MACNSEWTRIGLAIAGTSIIIIDFTINKPVASHPYKWSIAGNVFYYGMTRWTFVFAAFTIVFAIFFSPNTFIKEFARRPFFIMGGNLCLMASLVTPMAIEWAFNSVPDGIYLTYYVVVQLG